MKIVYSVAPYLFFSLLFLQTACLQSQGVVKVMIDSVNILPNCQLGVLNGKSPSTLYIQDSIYIGLENCTNNCLNIINIQNPSCSYTDSTLNSLCQTKNSFCFISRHQYYILNSHNQLSRREINNDTKITSLKIDTTFWAKSTGLTSSYNLGQLNQINIIKDSLLYFPVDKNVFYENGIYSKKNYDFPITATYNIYSHKINSTGIVYPKFLSDFDYGLLFPIHQLYLQDAIIYSFECSDEIIKYDLLTGISASHHIRSRYETAPIKPVTIDKKIGRKESIWNHKKYSAAYGNIIYDPYRNIFYRFYEHSMPVKGGNNLYNTTDDKRMSVIIFNENFEIMDEVLLPNGAWYYYAICSPDGLFMNTRDIFKDENDNKIGFKLLRIRVVNH